MKPLLSIQYLRAIAAMMVVVFHIRHPAGVLGYQGEWPDWTKGGVDLFFVISGFIMWATTTQRSITPVRFMGNRIIRVVPIYWVMTTVAVIASGALTWHTLASYLFIPALHPTKGEWWPVLIPGWTLNYEMFFYVLFAIALAMRERLRLVFVGAVLLGLSMAELSGAAQVYTNSIILEFALGMAIGAAYKTGRLPNLGWAGLVAGFLLFPLLESLQPLRFIGYGVPSAVIVMSALSLEHSAKEVSTAHLLGDASYSLYLTHGFSLAAISKVWAAFSWGFASFVPVALVGTSIAGVAIYIGLERPLTSLLRSANRNRGSSVATECP